MLKKITSDSKVVISIPSVTSQIPREGNRQTQKAKLKQLSESEESKCSNPSPESANLANYVDHDVDDDDGAISF